MAVEASLAMQADSENTILVISSSGDGARQFVHRLTGSTVVSEQHQSDKAANDESSDPDLIPWLIENKYYTAQVFFRLCELDEVELWERGVEVVLYAFVGSAPNPLPPALTRSMVSSSRDVALAIRLADEPRQQFSSAEKDTTEELFDELGMELVVEDEEPEDDDERPISPLEAVRQTLMTHMWPKMQRKPLGVQMPLQDDDGDNANNKATQPDPNPTEPSSAQDTPASFAVRFGHASGSAGQDSANGIAAQSSNATAFPDIAQLRSQIATANLAHLGGASPGFNVDNDLLLSDGDDEEDFGEFRSSLARNGALGATSGAGLDNMLSMLDRLEALDMATERAETGPAPDYNDSDDDDFMRDEMELGIDAREYDRLEEWLDEEEGPVALEDMGGEAGSHELLEADEPAPSISHPDPPSGSSNLAAPQPERSHSPRNEFSSPSTLDKNRSASPGFEDDFADFQSGPSTDVLADHHSAGDLSIPLDPTPLLLHLQSVRAELMGVENEDERRVRAGQEVERVMRSLGMS